MYKFRESRAKKFSLLMLKDTQIIFIFYYFDLGSMILIDLLSSHSYSFLFVKLDAKILGTFPFLGGTEKKAECKDGVCKVSPRYCERNGKGSPNLAQR